MSKDKKDYEQKMIESMGKEERELFKCFWDSAVAELREKENLLNKYIDLLMEKEKQLSEKEKQSTIKMQMSITGGIV